MGGLLGLVLAMLMETLLVIIRCSTPERLPVEKALREKRGTVSATEPHNRAAKQPGAERSMPAALKSVSGAS